MEPPLAAQMSGNDIPPEYYTSIEKGFKEAANSGALIGAPVEVRAGQGLWCACMCAYACVRTRPTSAERIDVITFDQPSKRLIASTF